MMKMRWKDLQMLQLGRNSSEVAFETLKLLQFYEIFTTIWILNRKYLGKQFEWDIIKDFGPFV